MGGTIVQHIIVHKLIYGVGINDKSIKVSYNGKLIKEYMLWMDMLKRCYSPKSLINSPTYYGCTVSENFKHFTYFYNWCQNQIGFNQNWQLDKDILQRDNKIYHENLCIFVPQKINLLFVKSSKIRGIYPIGVYLHKPGKYSAGCTMDGKHIHLGLYETPEKAFLYINNLKKI